MKPKKNMGSNPGTYDNCQTPPYALDPLLPYLQDSAFIWECAVGSGTLFRELLRQDLSVFGTDLIYGQDFFDYVIGFDCIVTNPPYSIKYKWLERCYKLGRPFALLMPVEMVGTAKAQFLFEKYGVEIIYMTPRVDFLMPHALWAGHGAQFPVAWYTWKLNLPQQINFFRLNKPSRKDLPRYWEAALGSNRYKDLLLQSLKHYFLGE